MKIHGARFGFLVLALITLACANESTSPSDNVSSDVYNASVDYDRLVFLTSACTVVNESGANLNLLAVTVGMRVRFANATALTLTMILPAEALGVSNVTLAPGEFATVTVQADAEEKMYDYSIEGCKQSVITANPSVCVSDGEDPPNIICR